MADDHDHIALLAPLVPLLLDAATFLTGATPQATHIHNELHASSGDHGFHEHIAVELRSLLDAQPELHRMHHRPSCDELAACGERLLRTVEDDFIICDVPVNDDADEYPHIRSLLRLHGAVSSDGRVPWLVKHTGLIQPTRKRQRYLERDLSAYRKAVASYVEPRTLDEPAGRGTEWSDARTLFTAMTDLHALLCDHIETGCQTCADHLPHSSLSFPRPGTHRGGPVSCLLSISPHMHQDQNARWKALRVRVPPALEGAKAVSTVQHERLTPSDPETPPTALPDVQRIPVCEIANRANGLKDVHVHDRHFYAATHAPAPAQGIAIGDSLRAPLSLSEWIHTPELGFRATSLKHRLSLALHISYAYLHLNGTVLWPCERLYTTISFFRSWRCPGNENYEIEWPFITILPDDSEYAHVEAMVPKMSNPINPSLPVLGKLLIEIFSGERLDWNNVDRQLASYKKDLAFGHKFIPAAEACLLDPAFVGKTMEDEDVRSTFVSKVVLEIQSILTLGWGDRVIDAFTAPEPIGGAAEGKSTKNAPAVNPTLLASSVSYSLDASLFDDSDDEGDENSSDAAAQWLDKFNASVPCDTDSCSSSGCQPAAIKIAVIDTGVCLSQDIRNTYDDRIVECRSWLQDHENQPIPPEGIPFDFDRDDDGHGTHATASLLDFTEQSGCDIYVARVFPNRCLRPGSEQQISNAVALAIKYAVTNWRVDIISMSFGFSKLVPAIEDEIRNAARRSVLMFAAASNDRVNGHRSWPSRDRNVICVHTADGFGTDYSRNPKAWKNSFNLAFPGVSISAYGLAQGSDVAKKIAKSGTSSATPVACAVAASILGFMARHGTLGSYHRLVPPLDEGRFQAAVQRLRTAGHMQDIFELMSDSSEIEGDYDYVKPWALFDKQSSSSQVLEKILNKLES